MNAMTVEKEVIALWKDISPESAFGSGIKECAGQLWIPSHNNVKGALARMQKLEKKTKDPVILKFLASIKRDIVFEEPQGPPGGVMGVFYTHLIIEGVKEKHMLTLAEQSLNYLCVQEDILNKKWPVELQIFTIQECDGARMLLESIKKKCKKKETKDALTAVQKRLEKWKKKVSSLKLKRHDFSELFPILKKKSKGLGRKQQYRGLLHDWYDYAETPEQIEKLAVSWLNEELPVLKDVMKMLARRYKWSPTTAGAE